jgi:hypothetical protein
MRAVIDLLNPRSLARSFGLLAVGLVAANCSPDAVRFKDNPFATDARPPSETTGSVPRGQVEIRPLAELQPEGQPLPAASSRAPLAQPPKRGGELPAGKIEEPRQARRPSAALPASCATGGYAFGAARFFDGRRTMINPGKIVERGRP